MKVFRYKILLLLFLSAMNTAKSQVPGLDLLAGNKQHRFYFQYVQGFILVELQYGHFFPMKFIFDTGAQNTILFDYASAGLSPLFYDRQILITGADLTYQMKAQIGRGAIFKIQDLPTVKRDIIILEENYLNIEEIIGQKVHGILGSDFFKGLIVELNYKKGYIDIYNAQKFNYNLVKDFEKIDVDYIDGKPYVNSKVNIHGKETITAKLLIDTGAALGLLLHNDTHPSLTLPEKTIRGSLGKGLSGNLTGYVGRINAFSLGSYNFNHLVTYYQEYNKLIFGDSTHIKRNGILGNYLLDRFHIFFDMGKSDVYIKAIKNYNKTFKYDKSGLVVFATGPNLTDFIINDVLDGSPAQEAGILPGDKILKVNWRRKAFLTLDKISGILSDEKDSIIKLKIKRGNQKLVIKFQLRDLL